MAINLRRGAALLHAAEAQEARAAVTPIVISGRAKGASPESITTGFEDRRLTRTPL
jgi:hypothetical protein